MIYLVVLNCFLFQFSEHIQIKTSLIAYVAYIYITALNRLIIETFTHNSFVDFSTLEAF